MLEVADIKRLTDDIWEMELRGDFPYKQIQAGQFINIRIGNSHHHILRRPISVADVDETKMSLTIVFRVVGQGTKYLSQLSLGNKLDVMGPLGTGFPLPDRGARVLIVGGGVGVPPLYKLTKDAKVAAKSLDIILGFRNAAECFWQHQFGRLGRLVISTEDGSLGIKGSVTDALDKFDESWDYVYACGPRPMLVALKEYFRGCKIMGYVSLEEHMACGVGACYGCVCTSEDRNRNLRICKEGPVFPWGEVDL